MKKVHQIIGPLLKNFSTLWNLEAEMTLMMKLEKKLGMMLLMSLWVS